MTGVCWVLSLVNLIFKDIQQVLTYVTIMLLVASPIAYTPDMLPPQLRLLIYINPLALFRGGIPVADRTRRAAALAHHRRQLLLCLRLRSCSVPGYSSARR